METRNLTGWKFKISRVGKSKSLGLKIQNLSYWKCKISHNAAYKRPDGVYVVPITALKD